jgi:hypothetical protein
MTNHEKQWEPEGTLPENHSTEGPAIRGLAPYKAPPSAHASAKASRHFQVLPSVSGHCQGLPRKRALRVAPQRWPCSVRNSAGRMEAFRPRALRADVFSMADFLWQSSVFLWLKGIQGHGLPTGAWAKRISPSAFCVLCHPLCPSGLVPFRAPWAFLGAPCAALRTGGRLMESHLMGGHVRPSDAI